MSIFLFKSLLSLLVLFLAIVAVVTIYEVFGRTNQRSNIERLKRIHKANGFIYILLFLFIAYFCLSFIVSSKTELSPRSTFHSIFALTIIVLFLLKVSIIRIYKQFYNQAKTLGLLIALITFGVVWTSGGYYLLVTSFGRDTTFDKIMQYKRKGFVKGMGEGEKGAMIKIKEDQESIGQGKTLFDAKCGICHDAYSTQTIVGPGLKGVLKKPRLPVSERPSTPENIRSQLKTPFNRMPSFDYLSEEEITDIIAFLNTI